MSTLAEFLLARIAEDEDRAHGDIDHFGGTTDPRDQWIVKLANKQLAEAQAKRQIIGAHRLQAEDDDPRAWIVASGVLLRALASVYIEHADYRDEWTP